MNLDPSDPNFPRFPDFRAAARADLNASGFDTDDNPAERHTTIQTEAARSARALLKNEPLLDEAIKALISEAERITLEAAA